jgi:hypothetical protein
MPYGFTSDTPETAVLILSASVLLSSSAVKLPVTHSPLS